jgi:uncharacterized protein (TIGR00369 family)
MEVTPFNSYLGGKLVAADDGTASVILDLEPHHLNRRGVAHGGVITTLLDCALGAAVISSMPVEWWCATTSLSTQFIAGAGTGRLTASGRVSRRGARVAFAAGEVHDDGGRLVAQATGTWHLWPRKPGGPEGRRQQSSPTGPFVATVRGERLRVGKILAVGRNYADHVREMGAPAGSPPVVFYKPPTALAHDGSTVCLPTDAGEIHHEVELVAVIGRAGKRLDETVALAHVLGYAVGIDLTLRDVQSAAKKKGEPWSLAKGFDASAPVSTIVPRDEVGDGSGLDIFLDVNCGRRQQVNTSQMLNSVAAIVAHVSRWITLERGDLIFTGTPSGVGPLVPGDHVEAGIEKVGSLALAIGAERPGTEGQE